MSNDLEILANQVIEKVQRGLQINDIRKSITDDNNHWSCISKKAFDISHKNASIIRKKEKIDKLLELNSKLSEYALSIPTTSTWPEINIIEGLIDQMPENENKILDILAISTMDHRIRAMQKKGRFEHLLPFTEFTKIIESATISFYRKNYIGAYLTLIPVIEGIILRWMGFPGTIEKKPSFDKIKKFFLHPFTRQPCPNNILFYKIYSKGCDKLLTDHLFKNSDSGDAYADFNRHLASHLLKDSTFATKANCIRLFVLLDTMSELYIYETKNKDPRWSLKNEDFQLEFDTYLMIKCQSIMLPEDILFETH